MDVPDIRLILTDIDETILPRGASRVSDRTVRAIHAALDAGLRVGPASGRGIDWIPPFFGGDEQCCSTCLATNGLQVYLDGRLAHEEHQPHDALEQAAAIVSEVPRAGMLCFDGGTPLLVAGTREDLAVPFPSYAKTCKEADGVPAFPVVKANVFINGDEAQTRQLLARLNEGVDALDFDYARVGFSNVMPHGYNKGSGVLMLCELLGIDTRQVVVFGDAGNDLPMFAAVENSVAVANAQPEAAKAARWHIGSCQDDAVASAIEALAAGEWPFR
ncbi:MAG: HAD family hydrolase [Tractidigestivibacter sp.]|jgi:hydroxymethylpyrimidine pyrophosphatase-like HAD family hydrolase|uniref:HAD family hydrolase n=1 Tax=Tractidigestivibacter sp. TaxID=2847320 RepID=UPI003D8B68EC